jgi:hypothetical protein
VGVDFSLVKALVPAVLMDMLLLRCPICKDEGKGGGQVCCKDCVAEEGGRKEALEGFEVDEATSIRGRGWGGWQDCQP